MSISSHPLYKEFYRWEQLGRGNLLWNQAVQPEPFFHPFKEHGIFHDVPDKPLIDDGLIPSPITQLKNRYRKTGNEQRKPKSHFDPLEYLETREAPSYCHDHRENLIEIVLLPPSERSLSSESFEYLLYALSSVDHPVCFEIVATSKQITIQLVVDFDDLALVVERLGSFLPELKIEIPQFTIQDLILIRSEHHIISRELSLEREFVFPIRTSKSFSVDPYQSILTSLSNLSEDELAVIQISFQPCLKPWAKSLRRLVTLNDQSTPFFENGQHFLRAAEEKSRKPLMAATVRLAVMAPTEVEARDVAKPIAGAFLQYEDQNSFILAEDDNADLVTRMVELALRRFRRSGMILNMDELLSLVHLPGVDVHAPKLVRQEQSKGAAPPEEVTRKNDHILGTSDFQGENVEVTISDKDRLSHCHVIGASGSGKSTFLLHSILQDIDKHNGVAVLDPHGDLVRDILERMPDNRLKDVVLFDPGDEQFPVGFNILSAKSDVEKNLLESDLVSIFQRLATSWGDQMTTVLANAVMAFLESSEGGTLSDLRRFLVDKPYRDSFVKTVTDPDVRLFWQDEFNLLKGNTTASLTGRLNTFMRTKVLRNMVAQKNDRLDFRDIMDSGKIFLAPLSMGLTGEENTKLLGSLLVSKFYQTALTRQNIAEDKRSPFFLYLDEAAHFATSSLATILTGTRKYSLGIIIAHHYLNQFSHQNAAVLNALLSNAHTRICFKVEDQDARRMANSFDGYDESALRQLTVGKAVCRIGPSNHSFSIKTIHPDQLPESNPDKVTKAREHSRKNYARPKADVEEEYSRHVDERIKARRPKKTIREQAEEKVESLANKPKPESTELDEPKETLKKSSVKPREGIAKTKETISERNTIQKPPTTPISAPDKPILETTDTTGKLKGRGSAQHKALQQRIHKLAIGFGLGAEIEHHLPDKRRIDVFVSGQGIRIAFEVALHTDSGYEVGNIKKGLQHKMQVIVISDDNSHLETIKGKAIADGVITSESGNVQFVHQNDIARCFDKITKDLPDESQTIHGLQVERSVSPSSDTESKIDELYRMFGK